MKKLLILLLLVPSLSWGYCSEPSAPWNKPSKPSVPFCVNEWDNTHTCSDWEISSYNSSINSYNNEVQSYINQLQNYVYDSQSYANCEMESLN